MTSVVIEKSVRLIEPNAFSWCSSLTHVTLPENLVSIGENSFAETRLEDIVLPKSLTTIAENRFLMCLQITNIVNCAFSLCLSLSSVTLENCNTWIASTAFYGLSNVTITCIPSHYFTPGANVIYGRRHTRVLVYCFIHFFCDFRGGFGGL